MRILVVGGTGIIGKELIALLREEHEVIAIGKNSGDYRLNIEDKAAISKMYDTDEWEEVRARNGWVNIHNNGDDFKAFLESQEQVIGDLMRELGFL